MTKMVFEIVWVLRIIQIVKQLTRERTLFNIHPELLLVA